MVKTKAILHIMVFPAYAGVIPKDIYVRRNSKSLSRVCGGDPEIDFQNVEYLTSFPRMRG